MTGEECADAINYLLENKDIPQIFPPVDEGSCPTVRCSAPCSIKVCPEVCSLPPLGTFEPRT